MLKIFISPHFLIVNITIVIVYFLILLVLFVRSVAMQKRFLVFHISLIFKLFLHFPLPQLRIFLLPLLIKSSNDIPSHSFCSLFLFQLWLPTNINIVDFSIILIIRLVWLHDLAIGFLEFFAHKEFIEFFLFLLFLHLLSFLHYILIVFLIFFFLAMLGVVLVHELYVELLFELVFFLLRKDLLHGFCPFELTSPLFINDCPFLFSGESMNRGARSVW